MLILNRKRGQSLVVVLPDGRPVRIALSKAKGRDNIKCAINAPDDVVVLRSELYDTPNYVVHRNK